MKKRNSNIELLRIISMIMIIISHYTTHNTINNSSLDIGINRFILECCTLGNLGVVIFLIITGYFSIKRENTFNSQKFILLILQVLFYSISIYSIFIILGVETFSIKNLVKVLLPISFKEYWFFTVYIILYIFTPYINKLLINLNKRDYLKLLSLLFLIFSIFQTLTNQSYFCNALVEFIFYYSIGAYIKLHYNDSFKYNYLLICSCVLLLGLSVIVFDLLSIKFPVFLNRSAYLFKRTSPLIIILAVSIFCTFKTKKEYSCNILNKISSCVFGVYLIHDNRFVRKILWTNILQVPSFVETNLLFLHLILSVLVIFISCVFIEFIRKNTIERIFTYLINKIFKLIGKKSDV